MPGAGHTPSARGTHTDSLIMGRGADGDGAGAEAEVDKEWSGQAPTKLGSDAYFRGQRPGPLPPLALEGLTALVCATPTDPQTPDPPSPADPRSPALSPNDGGALQKESPGSSLSHHHSPMVMRCARSGDRIVVLKCASVYHAHVHPARQPAALPPYHQPACSPARLPTYRPPLVRLPARPPGRPSRPSRPTAHWHQPATQCDQSATHLPVSIPTNHHTPSLLHRESNTEEQLEEWYLDIQKVK